MGCFSCSAGKGMCLHSQLPRTGSSGHWLKQKKLWVSISGSSPFPAGLGSCCPLPGPLDPPHPIQALGVQARNVSVSPWRSHWAHQCSPWGCALPFLHSPYSKPCTEFPCHRCLPWSPPWQEPGARGTLQHPGSPPGEKQHWAMSPFSSVGPRWAPRKGLDVAQMDRGDTGQHPQVTRRRRGAARALHASQS